MTFITEETSTVPFTSHQSEGTGSRFHLNLKPEEELLKFLNDSLSALLKTYRALVTDRLHRSKKALYVLNELAFTALSVLGIDGFYKAITWR